MPQSFDDVTHRARTTFSFPPHVSLQQLNCLLFSGPKVSIFITIFSCQILKQRFTPDPRAEFREPSHCQSSNMYCIDARIIIFSGILKNLLRFRRASPDGSGKISFEKYEERILRRKKPKRPSHAEERA